MCHAFRFWSCNTLLYEAMVCTAWLLRPHGWCHLAYEYLFWKGPYGASWLIKWIIRPCVPSCDIINGSPYVGLFYSADWLMRNIQRCASWYGKLSINDVPGIQKIQLKKKKFPVTESSWFYSQEFIVRTKLINHYEQIMPCANLKLSTPHTVHRYLNI